MDKAVRQRVSALRRAKVSVNSVKKSPSPLWLESLKRALNPADRKAAVKERPPILKRGESFFSL